MLFIDHCTVPSQFSELFNLVCMAILISIIPVWCFSFATFESLPFIIHRCQTWSYLWYLEENEVSKCRWEHFTNVWINFVTKPDLKSWPSYSVDFFFFFKNIKTSMTEEKALNCVSFRLVFSGKCHNSYLKDIPSIILPCENTEVAADAHYLHISLNRNMHA